MKTLKITFFSLLVALFSVSVFSSCGKNDDPWTETTTTQVTTSSSPIQTADGTTTYQDTITLAELAGSEIANNLISSNFQNSGWSIKLSGLQNYAGSSSASISDIKISVNGGTTYDLGKWTTISNSPDNLSDTELSSNSFTNFINAYFNALTTGSKKAILRITTTSSSSITKSNNVSLQIKVTSIYTYKKYTK